MRAPVQVTMIANFRRQGTGGLRRKFLLDRRIHILAPETDEFRDFIAVPVPAEMPAELRGFFGIQAEPRREHDRGRHAKPRGQSQREAQARRRLECRGII